MTGSVRELQGEGLHAGTARGQLLRLDAPVFFWGGVDPAGRVVDVHHPQVGEVLASKVVEVRSGRGSSSSTAVLAEQIRSRSAPAAILLSECDSILVVAALVAAELYGVQMPIVRLDPADLAALDESVTSVLSDENGGALVRLELG